MKILYYGVIFLLSTSVTLAQSVAIPPPTSSLSAWVPPVSREKVKTPFAPKPTTGDNIFKGEAEKWLADAIIKIEVGSLTPIKDKEVSDYISRIGMNLLSFSANPKKQFEFIVLDNDEENAMNIGGGRVYINLGMLKAVETEDELVGVLAHEIGHDLFGHAPKTVTRQLFWMKGIREIKTPAEAETALIKLLEAYQKNKLALVGEALLGWSRASELEADKAAFYNAYRAGYNPEAIKSTFRRYVKREKEENGEHYAGYQFLTFLFGSHPPSSQRVTAQKWESTWVKMPPKDVFYKNAAFDAMKARVAKL
jgi:beta-barrel assembly-enhancing protease